MVNFAIERHDDRWRLRTGGAGTADVMSRSRASLLRLAAEIAFDNDGTVTVYDAVGAIDSMIRFTNHRVDGDLDRISALLLSFD